MAMTRPWRTSKPDAASSLGTRPARRRGSRRHRCVFASSSVRAAADRSAVTDAPCSGIRAQAGADRDREALGGGLELEAQVDERGPDPFDDRLELRRPRRTARRAGTRRARSGPATMPVRARGVRAGPRRRRAPSSPAGWPWLSLSRRKLSMSIRATPSGRPLARARSISTARWPTSAPWLSVPVSGSRRVASSRAAVWRVSRPCADRKMRSSSDRGDERRR